MWLLGRAEEKESHEDVRISSFLYLFLPPIGFTQTDRCVFCIIDILDLFLLDFEGKHYVLQINKK